MLRLSTFFCYGCPVAPKRPYHHGNLRPVLLSAAIKLIAEVGPAAFTLREVARRAGISHNAPYRHFRDKDELLAAVATEGFERLAEALTRAVDSARATGRGPGSLERLRASGLGYVQFALHSPEHLQVMFDWPLDTGRSPALAQAGNRAFSILVGLVAECQRESALPAGDPLLLARIAWSLVHGVAKLAIGKRLPLASEREILHFTGQAIDTLQHGMATRPVRSQHGSR
jgi:AcrR family transcriptional regulator